MGRNRRLKKRIYLDPQGRRRVSACWYAWVPKRGGGGLHLVSTGCTDKRAAEAKAGELELLAVDKVYAASTTTLESVLSDYIQSRKRMNRAEASIAYVEEKSGTVARVFVEEFGLGRAVDVTHSNLLRYIDHRRSEGARSTTVKKELRVLGGAWKLARRNGKVPVGVDEIMPELDDDAKPKERWLDPWELVGLATVLPSHRMAQVAWMCATGSELGAVGRARPEDVDGWRVHVRGTKRDTRDRWAPVVLPEQRSLLTWAVAHADGGIGGRLFSSWTNVRNDLAKACIKLGLVRCSPNDFRRTYSTWLRNEGRALEHIAPAMGHKDTRMLERVYARLSPVALERLLARPMLGSARESEEHHGQSGVPDDDEEACDRETFPCEVLVVRDRIELSTRGFSVWDRPQSCSDDVPNSEGGRSVGAVEVGSAEDEPPPIDVASFLARVDTLARLDCPPCWPAMEAS